MLLYKIKSTDIATLQIQNTYTTGKYGSFNSLVISSKNLVKTAASEIIYGCVQCRNCEHCKDNQKIELMNIKEEIERDLTIKTLTVDLESRAYTEKLLGLHNVVVS